MNKGLWACLLGLLMAIFSWSSGAQPVESGSPAVMQLTAILEKTGSLRAEVEQLMLDQEGRELQEVRATLIMQKPDHFYWQTSEPYEQLMLTDGQKIWIYEPDLEQVTIQAFDAEVGRTPVLLLSGSAASLAEAYDIEMALLPHNGRTRFVLLPKDPGSLFERLSLTFFDDKLEEMQFEDSLGQKTSLSFSGQEVNVPIAPEVFEFVIPPGTDVIDGT
ncbi:MAG: outer membrane lipoprotein chaperone LolA [Pseudomonadales bacterium]|nr:outer membrane lipoprotein chaperone LolA [Pseudomonadales bacterium]